jgi:hypothetical protein
MATGDGTTGTIHKSVSPLLRIISIPTFSSVLLANFLLLLKEQAHGVHRTNDSCAGQSPKWQLCREKPRLFAAAGYSVGQP